MRPLLLTCLAVSAAAAAANAQRPKLATIVGIVADTNRVPVAEVEIIAIRSGITTLTDSRGGAPRSPFLTRDEIEKMYPRPFIDMLTKAGMKRVSDRRGKDALICPRGTGFGPPLVAYFIDGARVADPTEVLRMDPATVEAVEVYRSAAERPAQFNMTGSDCTVLVWTR